MSLIDLHIHSRVSLDGEFSPAELVSKCAAAGLEYISVTDHNSCRAVAEAVSLAVQAGITCIPGIEIDSIFEGRNLHLLGYGVDPAAETFEALHVRVLERERSVSFERIEKVNNLGFDLSIDDFPQFESRGTVAPEDIAAVLLRAEDAGSIDLLKPYLPGGSRSDNPYANFYWDFFADGKPCWCDMGWITLQEAVKLVIDAGGVPVLAHPGVTIGRDEETAEKVVELGVQGIECFSSYHDSTMSESWYAFAKRRGLTVTAGSDYHGYFKPSVKLGGYHATIADDVLLDGIDRLIR